jgi:SAM-dependent methyltransferase
MGTGGGEAGNNLSVTRSVEPDHIAELYRHRFQAGDREAKAAVWTVLVSEFFQRWVEPEDCVLDLGCGYGEFLNTVRCRRRVGVDLNPESVEFLVPDVEFHQGLLDDLGFVADGSVDVVFSSNVLEHLPNKAVVEHALREVRRVLRPGGSVLLLGPNVRYLPGEYWDFWDHQVPITDRSLVELLGSLGFRITHQVPRFLPYTTRSALPKSPSLVRWYLRLPLAWPFLGRQFFVRATTPQDVRQPDRSSRGGLVSIVLPVYNEGENIQTCLRGLTAALSELRHEILVCYDFDGDSTLAEIASMPDRPVDVRLVRNDLGQGVAHALRAGFGAAKGDVVVTTMADLSDPPEVIPRLVAKVREEGASVVSGSRYMPGGRQIGGPRLKCALSRLAGLSLHYLAGIPTRDPTTNFRAYSAEFLRAVRVQSQQGFEVALELTTKAHLLGYTIAEVPTTWTERSTGASKFRLIRWLPAYLRWYVLAFAKPMCGVAPPLRRKLGHANRAVD